MSYISLLREKRVSLDTAPTVSIFVDCPPKYVVGARRGLTVLKSVNRKQSGTCVFSRI